MFTFSSLERMNELVAKANKPIAKFGLDLISVIDWTPRKVNAKKALWDRIVVSTWTKEGHDIEHDAPFYSALRKLRDRGQTHIETYLTDLYREFTQKADAVLAKKTDTAEFDDADVHALVTEFEERLAATPRVKRVPIFQVYETPEQK